MMDFDTRSQKNFIPQNNDKEKTPLKDVWILTALVIFLAGAINGIALLLVRGRHNFVFPLRNIMRGSFISEVDYSAAAARLLVDFMPVPSSTLILGWLAALCFYNSRKRLKCTGVRTAISAGVLLSLLAIFFNAYLWFSKANIFGATYYIFGHFDSLNTLAFQITHKMGLSLEDLTIKLLSFMGTSFIWCILWAIEACLVYQGVLLWNNTSTSRWKGVLAIITALLILPTGAAFALSGAIASTLTSALFSIAGGCLVIACIWFAWRLQREVLVDSIKI